MKSYMDIAKRYLSLHKKKTKFTLISVILSVGLVTGIFSILDVMLQFEMEQVLKTQGYYHILIREPKEEEITYVKNRLDIAKSGRLIDFGNGTTSTGQCAIAEFDESIAGNLNIVMLKGNYPKKMDEVMIEQWYAEQYHLTIGDSISINMPDGSELQAKISAICSDYGATKAVAIPFVLISADRAAEYTSVTNQLFILFKKGVNIIQAEEQITKQLNIGEARIGRNNQLLAFMLQSKNSKVLQFYGIGAVLFGLVLTTAIIMINNAFHISVMERVRQFGLLRCVGASRAQIKRLVRREGMIITGKSIPFGILAGTLMSTICLAVLKYFNSNIYGNISIFHISAIGIIAGTALGFLSVLMASALPAAKAAKVSPVVAISGSTNSLKKKHKSGALAKLIPIEATMGMGNAVMKKKTLFLMTCSVALGIILYYAFSTFTSPETTGIPARKAYTADVSISKMSGLCDNLFEKLQNIEGVKRVYGRKSIFVNATFQNERLTDEYKNIVGKMAENKSGDTIENKTEDKSGNKKENKEGKMSADSNGLMINPEQSLLLSYDKLQLNWAKEYLAEGTAEEEDLNKGRGIISVRKISRGNTLTTTTQLQLGDQVLIKAGDQTLQYTVMGIVDTAPYSRDETYMTTFITTEELYRAVDAESGYETIDVQLKISHQNATVDTIKKVIGDQATFHDRRQFNNEVYKTYLTVLVFVYGFVAVIIFISILNIINTMNTGIVARSRYLGVLRAIGMSVGQLRRMVFYEAITYNIVGAALGCVLGIYLQQKLYCFLEKSWSFPVIQTIIIILGSMIISLLAIIRPLARITNKGIVEEMNEL